MKTTIQTKMTCGVDAWSKKHGTENLVAGMITLAIRHAPAILRESITFWTIAKEPDLTIRILVIAGWITRLKTASANSPRDDGDAGDGLVVLLDLIDGARILVAPARALPQRFIMLMDTEDSVTNLTLMLPEEY